MLIDWFTVAAQLVNFLILMWLMKRFLYQPILHAIDEREKRIASEIADAAKKEAEALKKGEEFRHKSEAFDQERAALLTKATLDAKAERERLFAEARKAGDAISARREATLRADEARIFQTVGRRTQSEVFSIARKALKDLAGADLEERMVGVFIRRLSALDAVEKGALVAALKSAPGGWLVRSSFELPPAPCAALAGAIQGLAGTEAKGTFKTAPELISGIELIANGQKVAWSIADYLASMKESVEAILKAKDVVVVKGEPGVGVPNAAPVSP